MFRDVCLKLTTLFYCETKI